MNVIEFYSQLFKSSIHFCKQKGSRYPQTIQQQATQMERSTIQGGIFTIRQKEDFTAPLGVKGAILTSMEALVDHRHSFSHFTPNPYVQYRYQDSQKQYIQGFSEEHLLQLNTFVVDIDTKKFSVQQLLLTCLDESIGMPTVIVESTRGYQLYFVLKDAFYLATDNKRYSLAIAKRISENLKRSLQCVEADLYCNDFGFFRLPTEDNIRFYQSEHVYSVEQFINWSTRFDDDLERPLFQKQTKNQSVGLMDQDWFAQLIQNPLIRGTKGQIGRNNAMFTIALCCYQEGQSFEQTFNLLDEWNSNLRYPLKHAEVERICRSAYSGKYNGPHKVYLEELIQLYTNGTLELPTMPHFWYKHKKERAQRTRSHLNEWEEDVINYIHAHATVDQPFIQCSQTELCKKLGIAKSSLNKLLNTTDQIIRFVEGVGRNAKTKFTTVALFTQYVIRSVIEQKKQNTYMAWLVEWVFKTTIHTYNAPTTSSTHKRRRRHYLSVHSA